jgi:hypothetical protein
MNFSTWFSEAVAMFFSNHGQKPILNTDQFAEAIRNYWDNITP